jgi:Sulfotransferase domain
MSIQPEDWGAEGRFEPAYGCKVFAYGGGAFTFESSRRFVEALRDFPLGDDDVVVVGFPKSGTNWLQITLANLYDQWGTTALTGGAVPQLDIPSREGFQGYEYSLAAASPRLMKAHCLYDHMPRAFREDGRGKVINIMRNPKDVCDSFYHQLDSLREYMGLTSDWNGFVESFANGNVPFGPWLDHVIGWLKKDQTTACCICFTKK